MTEATFPTFLHEDPRYFRRGTGSNWSRTCHAATRVFVMRTDAGTLRFNFSEVFGQCNCRGNFKFLQSGQSYGGANVEKLGEQISIDAASQVRKNSGRTSSGSFSSISITKTERSYINPVR